VPAIASRDLLVCLRCNRLCCCARFEVTEVTPVRMRLTKVLGGGQLDTHIAFNGTWHIVLQVYTANTVRPGTVGLFRPIHG